MILYFRRTYLATNLMNLNINEEKSETRNIPQNYPKIFQDAWKKDEEKPAKVAHRQNQMYSWIVLILAICYCIPAIQMVIKQHLTVTGNQPYFTITARQCMRQWIYF